MAEDGDLSELFEALEMEDDGKAEFRRGSGASPGACADDEWIIMVIAIRYTSGVNGINNYQWS